MPGELLTEPVLACPPDRPTAVMNLPDPADAVRETIVVVDVSDE